jgi:hypothetical protein
MSSETQDQFDWCLLKLTEMLREAAEKEFDHLYLRKAMLTALAMEEDAMIKGGVTPSVLKAFDRTTRKWALWWLKQSGINELVKNL